MSIKRQYPTTSLPSQIDITKEPYDRYLTNLLHWKIKDYETIIKTLQFFLKYKYKCLSEMEYISEKISIFHKEICRVHDKGTQDEGKVEVGTEYFQMVMELKARFKKLAKQGCFSGEKKRRNEFQEKRTQKKNLVNVNLIIPSEILSTQTQQYHKSLLSLLYRSFVSYYPQSHNDPALNILLSNFLNSLYKQMKRKYFYLRQREYFTFEVQKLCDKFRNPKYLSNKKLMLEGKILVRDIVMNRLSVFQNYQGKKREEQEMMKILRESEKKVLDDNYHNKENQQLREKEQYKDDQQEEGSNHIRQTQKATSTNLGEINEQGEHSQKPYQNQEYPSFS